mmetsp:Transcript_48100/g.151124  ORF Transcript_48100/g.151124 Transcript_48100/m.151124 type:complete len:275 (-) Transcript_48100:168-992(-)
MTRVGDMRRCRRCSSGRRRVCLSPCRWSRSFACRWLCCYLSRSCCPSSSLRSPSLPASLSRSSPPPSLLATPPCSLPALCSCRACALSSACACGCVAPTRSRMPSIAPPSRRPSQRAARPPSPRCAPILGGQPRRPSSSSLAPSAPSAWGPSSRDGGCASCTRAATPSTRSAYCPGCSCRPRRAAQTAERWPTSTASRRPLPRPARRRWRAAQYVPSRRGHMRLGKRSSGRRPSNRTTTISISVCGSCAEAPRPARRPRRVLGPVETLLNTVLL